MKPIVIILIIVLIVSVILICKGLQNSWDKYSKQMVCMTKCHDMLNACNQGCVEACSGSNDADCINKCNSMCSDQAMNCGASCKNLN